MLRCEPAWTFVSQSRDFNGAAALPADEVMALYAVHLERRDCIPADEVMALSAVRLERLGLDVAVTCVTKDEEEVVPAGELSEYLHVLPRELHDVVRGGGVVVAHQERRLRGARRVSDRRGRARADRATTAAAARQAALVRVVGRPAVPTLPRHGRRRPRYGGGRSHDMTTLRQPRPCRLDHGITCPNPYSAGFQLEHLKNYLI